VCVFGAGEIIDGSTVLTVQLVRTVSCA